MSLVLQRALMVVEIFDMDREHIGCMCRWSPPPNAIVFRPCCVSSLAVLGKTGLSSPGYVAEAQ